MDWDKLKIFKAVCDAGSLTKASKKLHLTQSSLSRQISKLEDELGVALFHRHARGLMPTHHGDILYDSACRIDRLLDDTQEELSRSQSELSGNLRISAPVTFGTHWLIRKLTYFTGKYPALKVDLSLSDERVDLRKREADVGLRFGFDDETALYQRYLCSFRWRLYASSGYLLRGSIKSQDDLKDHRFINMLEPSNGWLEQGAQFLKKAASLAGDDPHIDVQVNDLAGLLEAVRTGLGVTALPEFAVTDAMPIEEVATDLEGPEFDMYLVCAPELRGSERIDAFYAFVQDRLDQIEQFYPASAEIRCPLCSLPPPKGAKWECTCGCVWNTFETRGCCPDCGRRWGETECRSCRGVVPHHAWYGVPKDKKVPDSKTLKANKKS